MVSKIFERFMNEPTQPTSEITSHNETRSVGRIIKLSDEGWGFISSKDIPFTRIFFHWTSLKQNTLNFKELKVGMKVEFTPNEVPGKGFRGIKVEVSK